jgi:histidinol-phosphatase
MSKELLEAAEEVARLAGGIALRHYRTSLDVETKDNGTPVTIADREAEQAARAWIAKRYPDDGILGEEFGEQPGRGGPGGRRWLIDPIDGTITFVRGVPLWGTLVAVAEGDRVLAGAAFYPAVDEMLAAAPGEGCWWNGRRARVSDTSTLAGATVLITDERHFATAELRDGWRTLTGEAMVSRTWGDCYGYLLVATARAEVMVDPRLGPWDSACFQPIIEEAGGVFTDIRGQRTAFGGSAIATTRKLSRAVLEYLND